MPEGFDQQVLAVAFRPDAGLHDPHTQLVDILRFNIVLDVVTAWLWSLLLSLCHLGIAFKQIAPSGLRHF